MQEMGTKKIRLAYIEFAYKKTMDAYKLGDRFLKKTYFQSHICKIADKNTAYNEVCLYMLLRLELL